MSQGPTTIPSAGNGSRGRAGPTAPDPHLLRAVRVGFANLAGPVDDDTRLSFLVETDAPDFMTLRVPVRDLRDLPHGAQLSMPLADHRSGPSAARRDDGMPGAGRSPTAFFRERPAPLASLAGRTVIAFIDDGCAFAHRSFLATDALDRLAEDPRADGLTRVRAIWEQDGNPAPGAPVTVPYGRELDGAFLDGCIQAGHPPGAGAIDEAAVYRLAGLPRLRRAVAHGTHVMDIGAGDPPRRGNGDHARPEAVPNILFVQLPAATVEDTSGASLPTQVLDGLDWILARAPEASKVVVNLSFGAWAGPHDGSSLLERAIDARIRSERARREGGLEVVVAAGNARQERCHAVCAFSAGQRVRRLRWNLLPDDPVENRMEVWFPEAVPPAAVRVVLRSPRDAAGTEVVFDAVAAGDRGRDAPCVAEPERDGRRVGFLSRGPGGAAGRGTRLVVVLNPTRSRVAAMPSAPAGTWEIDVTIADTDSVPRDIEAHAWIERHGATLGSDRPDRQSRFLLPPEDGPDHDPPSPGDEVGSRAWAGLPDDPVLARVSRRCTLASLATGTETVVVGGVHAGAVRPGGTEDADPWSGVGPTRSGRQVTPARAASTTDAARTGVLAAGTRSGHAVRLRGTSMAAPAEARKRTDASPGRAASVTPARSAAGPPAR